MPVIAIVCGLVLVGIGVGGYVGAESSSVTALIPAAFGLAIGAAGILARDEKRLKMAMHIAATFGLLGFILPIGRLAMTITKEDFEWGLASGSMAGMAFVCFLFTILCVKSFIDVRRARNAAS